MGVINQLVFLPWNYTLFATLFLLFVCLFGFCLLTSAHSMGRISVSAPHRASISFFLHAIQAKVCYAEFQTVPGVAAVVPRCPSTWKDNGQRTHKLAFLTWISLKQHILYHVSFTVTVYTSQCHQQDPHIQTLYITRRVWIECKGALAFIIYWYNTVSTPHTQYNEYCTT